MVRASDPLPYIRRVGQGGRANRVRNRDVVARIARLAEVSTVEVIESRMAVYIGAPVRDRRRRTRPAVDGKAWPPSVILACLTPADDSNTQTN